MEYTDQSSGAIRLYLTKGDLDISQFTVLARKQIAWDPLSVDFGVLGESHFIQLTIGEKTFTEICACTDATIPEGVHVFESDFLANLPNDVRTLFDDYTYEFTFAFTNWEDGTKQLAKLREKQGQSAVEYLGHVFPKLDSDTRDPVTEVYVETGPDGILLFSVHTYPNEEMMVFTESSLRA